MTFLPFVLSFLVVLVLGSSYLMQSFQSSAREKAVIMGQRNARLIVIGEQAKKLARPKRQAPQAPREQQKKQKSNKPFEESRDLRLNIEEGKLNLWPILYSQDQHLVKALSQAAIELIEMLYQKADFYKNAHEPGLAKQLVDQMLKKEAETLLDLFPKDEKLAKIYYQMMRGSNTGYPAFHEYFRIEPQAKIGFAFASTPVLRAVLGNELTKQVLSKEKAKWKNNPRDKILTQQELKELIRRHPTSHLDINMLETIFTFNRTKGLPQGGIDKELNILSIKYKE